ncbi:sialic acid-binding Ig-like lectin 10 [Lacerta agilis]|uniref:sialic acid-binding Ig-like lectin 10 n=1 Tax=Lacerta agilis TaxID=80427 RepID=UPI001419F9CE|nr:sialic acid-binding Ig-like lectin 10 [Lacerta agilis]
MKNNKTLNNHMHGSKETLQLSNIKSEDAGMYGCQAENPHGSIKKNLSVIVQYRPRTMTFNVTHAHRRDPALARGCPREVANGSQLTVQEGNLLRLLCKADSNPAATTSWFKEGRALKKLSDDWLELVNVKVEDQGDYRCQAQNAIASAEGFLHLLVEYAPKLTNTPQKNTTCWRKDNGILCNCSLHSMPPSQIHWQVGGKTVAENSSTADLKVSSSVQKNEVTSSLIWTGSPDGDLSIICLGNNSLGTYTMQFLLSSLKTGAGSHSALLLSGLCGALLAAVVFLLCLGLIKLYKKRKADPKAATPEAVDSANYVNSANGGQQRANNFSLIYNNFLPQDYRWVDAVAAAAACRLAGGSVFFTAVPLGKQQQQQQQQVLGKSSSDAPVLLPLSAAPPGLLLLSLPANAASYPTTAPGWLERPNCGYWDNNWDR